MKIAVLKGDGIGPEIMDEALKILDKISQISGQEFEFTESLIGGSAWDKYGTHYPKETEEICKNSEAILFGSVGGPINDQTNPKWNNCEKNCLLALRKRFNFGINIRPSKVYQQLSNFCPLKDEIIKNGVDIFCVRELVGDIYFGEHKTEEKNGLKYATDVMEYDEKTIETVANFAFKAAQKRNKKVTSVDKANVLDCSKLWRETVTKIAKNYPDVTCEHMLVDNCAMQLIKRPDTFDVLLTPNMFGDILSDEISVFPGSLGMSGSASINNEGFGMYEPSGGSAPDISGKNIANPIGQILSAAMMLDYSFNMKREHDLIQNGVELALKNGYRTKDISAQNEKFVSTQEMGDAIYKFINN